MLVIQGTGRNKRILGVTHTGQIQEIKDLLCARKHVINKKGWQRTKEAKDLFAFVSSPQIYTQEKLCKLVKGWCHGFKKPDRYLPKDTPRILLPESDFMDPDFVFCKDIDQKPKYDYFYFTLNAKPGVIHKGLHVFFESLPILAKHKLRGLVIVYYPNAGYPKKWQVKMPDKYRQYLSSFGKLLKIHWGLLDSKKMNSYMRSCRFGFFPNVVDNSPRIISESLIRDVPILVNENIHGGWHYVSEHTGELFKLKNLSEKLDTMMTKKFNPRDYFMKHHGFEKSSKKLSEFVSGIFGYTEYSHMYFHNFIDYLEKIAQK